MRRITLLTDFGTVDGYVGAMKGVLATGAPRALVEDIAHDIPRGDVAKASATLRRYWRRYPSRTVHVVVVDPGVGTVRRGLALAADGRFVVAPDNGVLSGVLASVARWSCVQLGPSEVLAPPASQTFHGRDLFAPAAARLAAGVSLDALGPPVDDPIRLAGRSPSVVAGWVEGEVVDVDRFGNLATNLPPQAVKEAGVVQVAGRQVPYLDTYGDVDPGETLALLDSEGRVEIAVRDGSAAARLLLGPGSPVRVKGISWPDQPSSSHF